MEPKVQVVITIQETHVNEEAIAQLQASGLVVESAMGAIGIVTGTTLKDNLPKIRSLQCVASVEVSRVLQLRPPESNIQ